MIKSESLEGRSFPLVEIQADLVIAGGGLSGICAAITAARQGLTVALAHDRSVLGGNASSEIRLWILGATSHMGNNNRWAREGGVVATCLRALTGLACHRDTSSVQYCVQSFGCIQDRFFTCHRSTRVSRTQKCVVEHWA